MSVRADVAGGVLTEDHFIELITVGGVVVGVLDNGQFTALLTDPRGTPFVGPDGTAGLASAYGVRASHLGFADVIDYTRLGWDPDLDIVRMGVRDYDARLGQFLTPDPLYLENLDECQASPLQCALYGYAGGNPVNFLDPSGLGFLSWVDEHVVPRVWGGLKVTGAFVIAAGSSAMCTTGAGCVLGGAGLAYASSLGASGMSDVINGSSSNHQVNKAIASVTSQEFADNFDMSVGAAMAGWSLSGARVFGPLLTPKATPVRAPSRLSTLTAEEMGAVKGAAKPSALKIARTVMSELPDRLFEWGQCHKAAAAMVKSLKARGVDGQLLKISSRPYDYMVSDHYKGGLKNITKDGTHSAVRVGDMIFDNLNRDGVPADAYLKGLRTAGGNVSNGAINVTVQPF